MTGFFWLVENQVVLVTNWHNTTGLRADNLENTGSFYPTHFILHFWVKKPTEQGGEVLLSRRRRVVPLYTEDHSANWVEHYKRNSIDVVTLPLSADLFSGVSVSCLNEADFEDRWRPVVGSECYTVGFPERLTGQFETPIWKRGSIATEPELNHDELPVVLIDTLGNEGLSGSPVIAQSSGIFIPNGGRKMTNDTVIGTWQNFFGIYSGRTAEQGVGFQLGRVWKSSALMEIIENGVVGKHPKI